VGEGGGGGVEGCVVGAVDLGVLSFGGLRRLEKERE